MMGVACRVILQEQLERLNIKHKLLELGEIEIAILFLMILLNFKLL
jgi:hypothetical protein